MTDYTPEILEHTILNRSPADYTIESSMRQDWHVKTLKDDQDVIVASAEHQGEADCLEILRIKLGLGGCPILTSSQIAGLTQKPANVVLVFNKNGHKTETYDPDDDEWH